MPDLFSDDIVYVRAERPAGGYPSSQEIFDNVDNNLWDDLPSGQRVTGYTELRKAFVAVRSPNAEELMHARTYLASAPADPNVSLALFPCAASDEADALMSVLYRSVTKGQNSAYRLFADLGPGAVTARLYFAENQTQKPFREPIVGERLLFEDASAGSAHIGVVQSVSPGFWPASLPPLDYGWIDLRFDPPMTAIFGGAFYTDADHADEATPTQIYFVTENPIPMCGITSLAAAADAEATEITLTSLETPLAALSAARPPAILTAQDYSFEEARNDHYRPFVTDAAPHRVQTLPVQATSEDPETLVSGHYRYQGAWKTFSGGLVGSDHFLVTLPDVPDANTQIVYLQQEVMGGARTTFLFLLKPPFSAVTLTGLDENGGVVTAHDDGAGGWASGGNAVSGALDADTGLVTITLDVACFVHEVIVEYASTASEVQLGVDETIGIAPEWLPPSRTAPIFRVGETLIVHHTDSEALPHPLQASTVYPLSRSNVQRIWLEAADGTRIPTAQYTVDLAAGTVTSIAGLDLSGYQQPIQAFTTLEDEAAISAINPISRTIRLNQALRHAYPAFDTRVSSIVLWGDLAASVSIPFEQQAWTEVWSDARIGNPITGQYDAVQYPIQVTNNGAIAERWRIQFVGSTSAHIIGEHVGQIATAISITENLAPINPSTQTPYFVIDYRGFSAGFVSGNLLRFNTGSADAPLGLIRVTQPSPPNPAMNERIRLVTIGDVNV